jgi:hypothetical protein
MGLELLQRFWRIVDESETSCLSATILRLQAENVDLVLVGLVHFRELASEFILGDVCTVGMEDITIRTPLESQFQSWFKSIICGREDGDLIERQNLHDHLLAAEEGIADEFASSQRDRLLFVRHLCGKRIRLFCLR